MYRRPRNITRGQTQLAAVALAAIALTALGVAWQSRERRRKALLWRPFYRSAHHDMPAYSARAEASVGESGRSVRPAGSESMRDPPRQWDAADEQSDESFPASDPPATY
ncbi:hypothetical protein [Roseitranquillus sediminis]|uniref:hypothetical protein n=1 Tax=Roseitranquillus sediminis TaxID=2809051 RepID=UPI001D0C3D48|nr:hypothetical protein [Roseitranquillus sediminis]MBM9595189.1 hypothetical protein [Roseitranquillus sediminis]